VAFLSKLLEAGVDVRFADLPQIEGATGRFMLQQIVAVAELEAGMISARTKAALARSKKKLGGDRGFRPTAKASAKARAARAARSDARAADLKPTIDELHATGVTGFKAIAEALNKKGIEAARGGAWSGTQVMRLLARI
jgi:DNA invertase Pin-like site-specific DNA recombinase